MIKTKKLRVAGIALSMLIILTLIAIQAVSLPVGPTVTHVKNETSPNSGAGTNRTGDSGGYITTITLNASQQNYAWKAYVGNVSGVLTLENALNYSIYEWQVPNIGQEVYISRNGSVDWNTINCSNSTVTAQEDSDLNLNSSSTNSINRTFNATVHKSFIVAGTSIANSTCPAIATYVSDVAQASSEDAKFQEILLKDDSSNLIYAALVDQNTAGYDASLYDFQAIVAEDQTLPTPTIYYFYVELA